MNWGIRPHWVDDQVLGRTDGVLSEGEGEREFEIGSEQLDCNHTSTNVKIGADGTLDAATVSTLMACQTGSAGGNGTADE